MIQLPVWVVAAPSSDSPTLWARPAKNQTLELFRLECLTVDPLAGAVAMQCPLIRRRLEFPNAPKNRGDFRHID